MEGDSQVNPFMSGWTRTGPLGSHIPTVKTAETPSLGESPRSSCVDTFLWASVWPLDLLSLKEGQCGIGEEHSTKSRDWILGNWKVYLVLLKLGFHILKTWGKVDSSEPEVPHKHDSLSFFLPRRSKNRQSQQSAKCVQNGTNPQAGGSPLGGGTPRPCVMTVSRKSFGW